MADAETAAPIAEETPAVDHYTVAVVDDRGRVVDVVDAKFKTPEEAADVNARVQERYPGAGLVITPCAADGSALRPDEITRVASFTRTLHHAYTDESMGLRGQLGALDALRTAQNLIGQSLVRQLLGQHVTPDVREIGTGAAADLLDTLVAARVRVGNFPVPELPGALEEIARAVRDVVVPHEAAMQERLTQRRSSVVPLPDAVTAVAPQIMQYDRGWVLLLVGAPAYVAAAVRDIVDFVVDVPADVAVEPSGRHTVVHLCDHTPASPASAHRVEVAADQWRKFATQGGSGFETVARVIRTVALPRVTQIPALYAIADLFACLEPGAPTPGRLAPIVKAFRAYGQRLLVSSVCGVYYDGDMSAVGTGEWRELASHATILRVVADGDTYKLEAVGAPAPTEKPDNE